MRQTATLSNPKHVDQTTPLEFSVTDLTVVRGHREVISGTTFVARAGEALVVMGANGSGKTTLLRVLAGLLKYESGEVALRGADEDRDRRDYCHYIGHLNGIKASQTVGETLAFYAGFLNPNGNTRDHATCIDQAMEQFSLQNLASVPASYLSAGQKRRLCLARLLCAPRPVWLLDEPTTSLDQTSAADLMGVINTHVSNGGLLIAATHLDLGLANAQMLQLGAQAGAK